MSPIPNRSRAIRLLAVPLALTAALAGAWILLDAQQDRAWVRRNAERDSAVAADVAWAVNPASLAADSARMPGFEAYPIAVTDTFSGTPAPVDLNSAEGAREVAAVLRQAAARGPNFAGHYTVARWNDSSSYAHRQLFAIIDARTGRVHMAQVGIQIGLEYRLDSSMLITDPIGQWRRLYGPGSDDLWGQSAQTFHYHWDGTRLNPIDGYALGTRLRGSYAAQRHYHGGERH
jgi:hypothetical protein